MEELYLTFIQEAYQDNVPSHQLLHPDLQYLKNYDADNGTHLYDTMMAYLSYNRNIAEMSKALYISRSTGFYRINQIKELLNDPFSDMNRLFCYECAVFLMN